MNARGFTLLEALVTLVVIAMVATLLLLSLSQVLALRERVLRADREARVSALHERWFRDSVASAAADLRDGVAPFTGDATRIRFRSLDAPDGRRVAIVDWRLRDFPGGVVLDLTMDPGASTTPLLTAESARFRYLDEKGVWQTEWPPTADPDVSLSVEQRALPRAVQLTIDEGARQKTWLVDLGASPLLPAPLRVNKEVASGSL